MTKTKRSGKSSSEPRVKGPERSLETMTTAIHIRLETWKLLRAVAFRRAQDTGGRASVSKLIEELVERHRGELESEAKG